MIDLPRGVVLRHALRGHDDVILACAWSPDGRTLASGGKDGSIRLWDVGRGRMRRMFSTRMRAVTSLAFSPDGKLLAATSPSKVVRIFRAWTGEIEGQLKGHEDEVVCVAWSPKDGNMATASDDHSVGFWNAEGRREATMRLHGKAVTRVAFDPAGRFLASASFDGSVRLTWLHEDALSSLAITASPVFALAVSSNRSIAAGTADGAIHVAPNSGVVQILEGHTDTVSGLAFSPDGGLLASRSHDGTLRLWRTDTWEEVARLASPATDFLPQALAFHPKEPLLAATVENDRVIHLYDVDASELRRGPRPKTVHYANAKVVLVGDSGVGKSALGLVLTGEKFQLTESSHGRRVWTLERAEVDLGGGRAETREILLWDLAGQPGYRVFHRHHLNEVAVALVVYDARSEIDPFAGVVYWARALDEARRGFPLVKLLVAARVDRGGTRASDERIARLCERHGFAAAFQTSARRGDGVAELGRALREAIDWSRQPRLSTPKLFDEMKSFVVDEKRARRVLQRKGDLLERFAAGHRDGADPDAFDTCLGRLEAAGLVKRFTFGELVLLQPEMLDDYSGWLAHAAREEPDGLGAITEERARAGRFPMDDDRPLKASPDEPLLIAATVEDVIGRGIALRQPTERGEMLVFPSETRGDMPAAPGEFVRAVVFKFAGPVRAIQATLAVCLANTPAFGRELFFRDGALFRSAAGERCGFRLDHDGDDDARGLLTVLFGPEAVKETKRTFLRYVNLQLERMAFAGSVERVRVYQCECGHEIEPEVIAKRRAARKTTALCPVCERHLPLDDLADEAAKPDRAITEQAELASEEQARQMRLAVLPEREARAEFHVFLCHNSKDKREVRAVAERLRQQGVLPWIDEQGIAPGEAFVRRIEEAIAGARAIAIFVGPHDLGRWQALEYMSSLQRHVEEGDGGGRRPRLIPVLLPGADAGALPLFLKAFNWIDLRRGTDDAQAIRKLVKAVLPD